MKTQWLQGLEKQKEIDMRQNFKESLVLRKRFFEIAIKMIEEGRKNTSSKALFESPNWALYQASNMGYERAIRDMIELFSD